MYMFRISDVHAIRENTGDKTFTGCNKKNKKSEFYIDAAVEYTFSMRAIQLLLRSAWRVWDGKREWQNRKEEEEKKEETEANEKNEENWTL